MTRLRLLASISTKVFAILVLAILPFRHIGATTAGTEPMGSDTARVPVLIELFTSEGCSSCPPADALLSRLDRAQSIRTADIVVLSEHVDYWDDIGWRDPYSSRQFSVRQSDYAHRFRLNGPYTPQMVVDGDSQFVGNDERFALRVIENAAKVKKTPVSLSSIHSEADSLALHLEVGPPVSPARSASEEIWIALADDSDQSSVSRGENAGRVLKHVAVVRKLAKVGMVDHSGTFFGDAKVSAQNVKLRNLRVVAFVQETITGRVLGVGSARFSN